MIHVQPDKQRQLRRACDRCHKAKLRCLRSSEEPCERCQQVGAMCTSSPASRSQRQRSSGRRKTLLHAHASPKDNGRAEVRGAATALPIAGSSFTQTMMDTDRLDSRLRQISPSDMRNISPPDFETLPDFQNQLDQFMLLDSHGLDTSFDLSPDMALSANDLSSSQNTLPDALRQTRTPPLLRTMNSTETGALHDKGMMTSTSASSSAMSTTPNCSLTNSSTPATSNTPDDKSIHPIEHSMRKMNDFNITLMRYLQVIPIVRPGDDAEELLAAPGAKCPVDEVFLLTEQFIQVTKGFRTSSSLNTNSSLSGSTSLDAASQMIVLSTYLRLIDTYSRILQHVLLHCQQRRDRPKSTDSSSGDAGRIVTPQKSTLLEWSIGSFSLSSRSNIQQLFMLQLVETMLTQCRTVMGDITSEKANPGPNENGDCFGEPSLGIIPDLAMQAIRTREDATMHLVQQIKDHLSP